MKGPLRFIAAGLAGLSKLGGAKGFASFAGTTKGRVLNIHGVDDIIAVASGKGGVGKSTTAVNLAVSLASKWQLKVGLLDADVYGPSIPTMMGIHGKPDVNEDLKMIPKENYGVRCMSMGLLVDKDAPIVWRGPMVMSALQKMVKGVDWGDLDILVVDMPPGTGDAQLTISQQLQLSGAVIVSTPQDIALMDARRGAQMFSKVGVPILGVVQNMSCFKCPHCGESSFIFGEGGAKRTADELCLNYLGDSQTFFAFELHLPELLIKTAAMHDFYALVSKFQIPLEVSIRTCSDEGVPVVISEPNSASSAAYNEVAQKVIERLANHREQFRPEISL